MDGMGEVTVMQSKGKGKSRSGGLHGTKRAIQVRSRSAAEAGWSTKRGVESGKRDEWTWVGCASRDGDDDATRVKEGGGRAGDGGGVGGGAEGEGGSGQHMTQHPPLVCSHSSPPPLVLPLLFRR